MDSTVTTGAGKTGLTNASTGLIISTIRLNEASATVYTVAGSNVETIATLGTYAAPSANKCRFKEVDATNHPGIYELQFADARFTSTALVISISGVTGLAQADFELQCENIAVNVIQIGGTAQTARDIGASVLLSSGSGAGQLDFTSGVVKSNLVQILASVITGTAAQISAAFTKFFDKATPTGTINSLPDAVAGANGGLPTTNGTKVNQTVDLTAGQTIAATIAVGAIADDAITAAKIAADAIGSSEFAQAAADKVWASTASLNATLKTNLASAIWDELLSVARTALSIGAKIKDWVVGTIDTYTGNTKQTGDAYAIVNNGTYGNSNLKTVVDAGFTAGAKEATVAALNNLSAAQVKTQVDTALSDIDLDHISKVGTAPTPAIDSNIDKIMNKNGSQTFAKSTDSLEAIADAESSGLTAQQVRDAMKLAPSGGVPTSGSVDDHLDNIEAITDQLDFTEGGNVKASVEEVNVESIPILDANLVSINANSAKVTALSAAIDETINLMKSDVLRINGTTIPVGNFEDDYDGTGYNKVGSFEDGTVYVDNSGGFAGTTFPIGTAKKPSSNMADAIAIANNNKLYKLSVRSTGITLSVALTNMNVLGRGIHVNPLGIAANVSYCQFERIGIEYSSGSIGGVAFKFCRFQNNNISNLSGIVADSCHWAGGAGAQLIGFAAGSGSNNIFKNCFFNTSIFGLSVLDGVVFLSKCQGTIILGSLGATGNIVINGFTGKITIDSSCTAGTITIYGLDGELIDESAGATVVLKDIPGSKTYRVGTNNSDGDIQQDESTGDFNAAQLLNFDGLATIGADVVELQASIASVLADMALDATVAKEATLSAAASDIDTLLNGVTVGVIKADAQASIKTQAWNALNTLIAEYPVYDSAFAYLARIDDVLTKLNLLISGVSVDSISIDSLASIDSYLSAVHGAGAWDATVSSVTVNAITAGALSSIDAVLAPRLDGIKADTEDILNRLPITLTEAGNIKADVEEIKEIGDKAQSLSDAINTDSDRISAQVEGMNDDVLTAAALATDAVNEIQAGLATIGGTAIVEGKVDTVITNIAALNDISPAEVNTQVDLALADYDGPTKAEMDAGFAAGAKEVTVVAGFAAGAKNATVAKEVTVQATADNVTFLQKMSHNRMEFVFDTPDWYLVVYDDNSTDKIAKFKVEKFGGGAIDDLAGTGTPSIRGKNLI
jgi:hypothetical protein